MALSSIEAKYKGACMIACEATWLGKLLVDMGQSPHALVIYFDSISHIMLVKNLLITHSIKLELSTLR